MRSPKVYGIIAAAVAVALTAVLWLVLPGADGPTKAAISGIEQRTGLTHVHGVRSRTFGDCAVVEVSHSRMKYGQMAVALSKRDGRWTVVLVSDPDLGEAFDSDDVDNGEGCHQLLSSGPAVK